MFQRRCIVKSRQIGSEKISSLIASLQTGEKVVVSAIPGKQVGNGKTGNSHSVRQTRRCGLNFLEKLEEKQGSLRGRHMLDFPRYRIQPLAADPATVSWGISRPETGEQVGVVTECRPHGISRFLPAFCRGRQLEVREFPEPALVFRVVKPSGLPPSAARVYDALDERVGYFSSVPKDRSGRFEIYLSRLVRFAIVSGSYLDAEFQIVTPKGQALAQVTRSKGPANGEWLIAMDDCLEHEPIIKMLLLAAVLVLACDGSAS
jgi:hypothetical protein